MENPNPVQPGVPPTVPVVQTRPVALSMASDSPEMAALHEQRRSRVYAIVPTREELNQISAIADTFQKAGALPKGIDTIQKATVAVWAAVEYQIPILEALAGMAIIGNRVVMYGDLVLSQLYRAGCTVTFGTCNAEEANVTITRKDGTSMSQCFTMEEARRRGYTSNPVYAKYPEDMLKRRAIAMIAKYVAPDALRGISIVTDRSDKIDDEEPVETRQEALSAAKETAEAQPSAPAHGSLLEALKAAPETAAPAKKKATTKKTTKKVADKEA